MSHASLWEIAIKASLGKLELSGSFGQLKLRIENVGFSLLGFDYAHYDRLQQLPFHHKDPFDRMLIVQSMIHQFPLMSVDDAFKLYDIRMV